jgi:PAS domain S-box-containing protein
MGESERVLYVDDDAEYAALTATSLERTSDRLDVLTATSAGEAIEQLDETAFGCVVSDYDMPGADGLELLERVRRRDDDLPFILFTGTGSETIASEAIARGVTDYLRKRPGTETFELLANRVEHAIEQYRATERAERFDRLCRLVKEINRVLVRAETRAEIERGICEAISDIGPYRFAWIGDHDTETETVEPRATAGIENDYLDDVEITVDESATGRGPTGRAIRTGEVAIVDDIAADDAYATWRDDALDRGYRASAAVPLVDEDRLYGVLNVYADRTDAFDERERDVLAELGHDIAHALGRVERHGRYERIVENLPMGVYRVAADEEGTIVDANAALADIFGAESADAMLDHTASDFYVDDEGRAGLCRQLQSDGAVRNAELRQRTLDGNRIWVSVTAIRTETDDGVYFDGVIQDITDRKRRERQRRQFRSAVEHAGHVVLITDTDGTITYVNDAFEDVTGYEANEAIGRRPSMLQSGQHDEEFYRGLWETISSGEVWEGEVVNERKDGEQYIIDQTIAPITGDDGDGDAVGFVAVNRDVTGRKERELNLTFLKQAIDQAGIGFGTYNVDGHAAYVNERLAELFGTEREDLRTRQMADLDPTLDPDRFEEYWASFNDGERRIYDTRIERVDTGEVLPAEVVTSRVRIDGEPYQVNTVRDATDRKRQERDLERFRSAVEHAGHSVLITDANGAIEYVNDAFEAVTGYSAAEAIGRTPAMLRSGEHGDEFYHDLWETILDGDVWQGEVTNERKDGTQYVVDQTIAPIAGDGESITGFVAVNRDVTAIKKYERELEAQNDRLKQYGQTVAHDLRNPLALLDAELTQFEMTVDDADETVDAETVEQLCTDIGTAVDRMQALIDDLLAMAEQGQRVLEFEPVSIDAVATEAWEQIDAASATLSVEDTTIDADPDRLRELLSNLFRNSVEHAGADVTVRVEPLDFTEGFAVEDDGPGIPEAERDEVFEHGFTTAESGTGFGLAIVEQIANAHDWSASVTEGRDGGARFEFRADEV